LLEAVRLLYTDTAVVIGLVNAFLPLMALPLTAAIERIPPNLEEAAQNLGANWYQMFPCTILPLSLPGLISGSLLVYSISISGTTVAIAPPPAPSALTRRGVTTVVAHDLPGLLALDIAG